MQCALLFRFHDTDPYNIQDHNALMHNDPVKNLKLKLITTPGSTTTGGCSAGPHRGSIKLHAPLKAVRGVGCVVGRC